MNINAIDREFFSAIVTNVALEVAEDPNLVGLGNQPEFKDYLQGLAFEVVHATVRTSIDPITVIKSGLIVAVAFGLLVGSRFTATAIEHGLEELVDDVVK